MQVFLFCKEGGKFVGMKFLDLCLEAKYETIRYTMYSGRQSVYLKTNFDG